MKCATVLLAAICCACSIAPHQPLPQAQPALTFMDLDSPPPGTDVFGDGFSELYCCMHALEPSVGFNHRSYPCTLTLTRPDGSRGVHRLTLGGVYGAPDQAGFFQSCLPWRRTLPPGAYHAELTCATSHPTAAISFTVLESIDGGFKLSPADLGKSRPFCGLPSRRHVPVGEVPPNPSLQRTTHGRSPACGR